jgi:hypothetical protein
VGAKDFALQLRNIAYTFAYPSPPMTTTWLHFLQAYFSLLALLTAGSAAYLIRLLWP